MKVFILNSGSSSVKFQVIDMTNEQVLVKGLLEKIGNTDSRYTVENISKNIKQKNIYSNFNNHLDAIKKCLELLTDNEIGCLNSLDEIDIIGHRVVHGGEKFIKSTLITNEILDELENISVLAPLHNPANIKGIKICMQLMPNKKNIAVFDTAFHQTMEKEKYLYAIAIEDYEELHIRKYGFHGTSVRYVYEKTCEMLNKKDAKVIVCHLGNGASITAVKNNKSVNTTMGFTPLDGIPMGTRSGSIDPSIIEYLMKQRNLTIDEVMEKLNKKSGMLGLFGKSDNRDLTLAMLEGNEKAKLAFDIFVSRITSFISSYYVELEGIDALVFTGGIGENSHETRESVCKRLNILGAKIDIEKNKIRNNKNLDLSLEDSKFKIFKICTNEELMIAKDSISFI